MRLCKKCEKKASNLDQDMTILRHVIKKLKRVDFRIFNLKCYKTILKQIFLIFYNVNEIKQAT